MKRFGVPQRFEFFTTFSDISKARWLRNIKLSFRILASGEGEDLEGCFQYVPERFFVRILKIS